MGKKPPALGGLKYEKDLSRPGGGIFIVHGKQREEYRDMVPGTIISGKSDDDEDGMSIRIHSL